MTDCTNDELTKLEAVYADILDEVYVQLDNQVAKWGIQDHLDGTADNAENQLIAELAKQRCELARDSKTLTWRHILYEEIREAFAEDPESEKLRTELIQAAAVAIAWVENIDRRNSS